MSTLLLLGVALAAVPTKLKPPEERGEALYRAHCQGCHGPQALGDGPALAVLRTEAPALAGRVEARPQSAAISLVLTGRGDMPGFGSVMGLADARDILLWLSRLDPDSGLHPRKKPPRLPAAPVPSGGTPVPPVEPVEPGGEPPGPQGGGAPGGTAPAASGGAP